MKRNRSLPSPIDPSPLSPWSCVALFAFAALPGAAGQETQNWPQFRGPGSRGVAEGVNLPDRWSQKENVAWSVPISGRGWSSPVVWGEKIFLTSAISKGAEKEAKKGLYLGGNQDEPSPHEHRWLVWCLDANTGAVAWEREVNKGRPARPRHIKNNYAPETQVTDGETIFSYFGDVGLFAHDMEGNLKWERSWEPVKTRYGWGSAASPALYGDRVFIVNDNEESSFVEALDKTTGKTLWRLTRDEGSNWSTPFVWANSVRTELVTAGTGKTRSYGLDGKLLWQLDAPMSSITIATPYAAGDLLYVSSGFVMDGSRPVYALRPGAKGTIRAGAKSRDEAVAWVQPTAAPYNPTTLVYEGILYVLYDFGFLAAFDANTGDLVYGKQRIRERQNTPFTASPWAYGGKVFALSEDGDCFVFRAGRKYELLHVNSLDEMCMATPAVARGSLFVRTFSKLYRIVQNQ